MEPISNETSTMCESLRELFKQDPEARILARLRRYAADPVKPEDQDGRFRPHPVILLLGVIGGLATIVFLYFSYSHP